MIDDDSIESKGKSLLKEFSFDEKESFWQKLSVKLSVCLTE